MKNKKLKIYYINLNRSVDKKKYMDRQLKSVGISYERINALDGRKLDEKELEKYILKSRMDEWRDLLTPSAVACAYSHCLAYKKINEDDVDVGIVLEDDVSLAPGFLEAVEKASNHINDGDIILLYFHGEEKIFIENKKVSFGNKIDLHHVKTCWGTYSAGAYMLTKKTADQINSFNTPVYTTADSWGVYKREGAINALKAILPPPVNSAPFASDIGYGKFGHLKRFVTRGRMNPLSFLYKIYRYFYPVMAKYRIDDVEADSN